MKKSASFRLPAETLKKLQALAPEYGSQATAIAVAVDRLHRDENKHMWIVVIDTSNEAHDGIDLDTLDTFYRVCVRMLGRLEFSARFDNLENHPRGWQCDAEINDDESLLIGSAIETAWLYSTAKADAPPKTSKYGDLLHYEIYLPDGRGNADEPIILPATAALADVPPGSRVWAVYPEGAVELFPQE